MRKYRAVLECDAEGKWSLTVPALPGYVACGDTEEEVLALAREGIAFHIACLKEEGKPVPAAPGNAKVLDIEVAA